MSNDISIRKNKGQYMTPEPITTMILDTIGYTGQQILTKNNYGTIFWGWVFSC